jgi:hypothetical protein
VATLYVSKKAHHQIRSHPRSKEIAGALAALALDVEGRGVEAFRVRSTGSVDGRPFVWMLRGVRAIYSVQQDHIVIEDLLP